MSNQKVTKEELDFIRGLGDFDLTMLISEIHDFGWEGKAPKTVGGKALIPMMRDGIKARGDKDPPKELFDQIARLAEPGGALHGHPGIVVPKK